MFKVNFYVPTEYLEAVKKSMFDAGAGKIGNYDSCSWETLGQGQYRPLKGSRPFMGTENEVELVPEFKVEMVCEEDKIDRVIKALKAAHPYETPAFEVYKIL
ncbi:MAG: NGG1p interacting factor NIF3 [Bacteriovoracaceae bacterium]|nr:NGG1p interacting factor NIF3 [Bacteriovoracaceae bacterium]